MCMSPVCSAQIAKTKPMKTHKKTLCLGLALFLGCCTLAQSPEGKPYDRQLEQVEDRLRAGDIGGAVETLDGILSEHPEAADVHYARALVFGQVRNYDLAIESAERAFGLDPKNPAYANYLVELYKGSSNPAAVLAILDRAIPAQPENVGLFRERIMMLHANRRSDEALLAYDEAAAKFGLSDTLDVIKSEILLDLKRNAEAEKLLLPRAAENSPIRQVYSSLGYIYMAEKKPKKAIKILEKGLATSQDDLLYLDLADAYAAAKKDKLAFGALVAAFRSSAVNFADKFRVMLSILDGKASVKHPGQMLELADILLLQHPRIAESHTIKGDVQWQSGRLAEARSLYLTAVGLQPTLIHGWRKLISVEIAMNEPDAAVLHGMEAMNANPGNALAMYFTGLAYLAKDDTESARKMVEAALDSSSEEDPVLQSFIYRDLGDIYHKLAMHDVSDVAYEEAIKLDSTNATAMNNYAYYLAVRNEKLEIAAKYADMANALEPASSTFQDTYAWVLFKQGDYGGALRWMEKAMAGSKPSAVLHDHYGDILFKAGRTKDAVRQWEKALALGEGSGLDMNKLQLKIRTKNYVE